MNIYADCSCKCYGSVVDESVAAAIFKHVSPRV